MTRRCKAGQRARVISGANCGRIVLIVRPYFGNEVEGAHWPNALFPWVVACLGAPLRAFNVETKEDAGPHRMVVFDDCDLEPLDDEDDGLSLETDTGHPTERGAAKTTRKVAQLAGVQS